MLVTFFAFLYREANRRIWKLFVRKSVSSPKAHLIWNIFLNSVRNALQLTEQQQQDKLPHFCAYFQRAVIIQDFVEFACNFSGFYLLVALYTRCANFKGRPALDWELAILKGECAYEWWSQFLNPPHLTNSCNELQVCVTDQDFVRFAYNFPCFYLPACYTECANVKLLPSLDWELAIFEELAIRWKF